MIYRLLNRIGIKRLEGLDLKKISFRAIERNTDEFYHKHMNNDYFFHQNPRKNRLFRAKYISK